MVTKPKFFIGSSQEGLDVAYALQYNLDNFAEVTVWDQGVFQLSEYTLQSLCNILEKSDYGIFVFTPDDISKIRDETFKTVRDNVLFELGLCMGRLGKDRTFIILPKNLYNFHLPTDLVGLTVGNYDSDRDDKNLSAALGPACHKIYKQVMNYSDKNIINDKKKSSQVKKRHNCCNNELEMFEKIVELFRDAQKNIFVITDSKEWVFHILISVILARIKNILVKVLYYPLIEGNKNAHRMKLLFSLGCQIKTMEIGISPPFCGFFADYDNEDNARLILKMRLPHRFGYFAKVYEGPLDYSVIRSTFEGVNINISDSKNKFVPKLTRVSDEDMIKALKNVPFYKNCSISIENIDVEKTTPIVTSIRTFKEKQIYVLRELINSKNFDLYDPLAVEVNDGKFHYIVPPVLEEHDNGFFVAEGHTRLYVSLKEKEKKLKLMVVRGVSVPLGATPSSWDKIDYDSEPIIVSNIYPGWEYKLARKIETYTHLFSSK